MTPLKEAPVAGSREAAVVVSTVWAYPLLWAVGLGATFWPITAALFSALAVRRRWGAIPTAASAVGIAIFLSILLGLAAYPDQANRVPGALANVSVWIALGAALAVFSAVTDTSMHRKFFCSIVGISTVQGALVILSVIIAPTKLPLPLSLIPVGSLGSGAAALAQNRLYELDWLGSAQYRTAGIMGQPTWAGAFAFASIIIAAMLYRDASRSFKTYLWLAGSVNTVVVILSLSRSVWIIGSAVVLLAMLLSLHAKQSQTFWPLLTASFLSLAGVLILFSSQIMEALTELNDQRAGSSGSRVEIYQETWGLIEAVPIPMFGYGIKPQDEGLVASIGTHSTYLGLLFRAGIVGLAAFAVLVMLILRRSSRLDSPHLRIALLLFVIGWLALEDLDGGHLLPLVLVALINRLHVGNAE